jgi:hypothetical protein
LVYVDAKSHEVARVTLEAENLPVSFPVKMAQTILDYDYADISGHVFLLPIKDLTLMKADDYLSKNETEFRMYRKYSAESELKFDTDTPEPLPAEKTNETPATTPPASGMPDPYTHGRNRTWTRAQQLFDYRRDQVAGLERNVRGQGH